MTNQKIPIMEPNADQRTAPESKPHGRDDLKSLPLTFLTHFWSPIPCIIEAAVILLAVSRHWLSFAIILLLFLANNVVGFWEERHGATATAALNAMLTDLDSAETGR